MTEITPREAMDDFLLSLKGDRERNTIIYYRSSLRQLVSWLEENAVTLPEFRGRHFDRYLAHRADSGTSKTTRYHDSCCARKFLEYCRREDFIASNPLHDRKFVKGPHKIEYVPTDAEIAKLLRAAQERRRVAFNANARYTCQTDRTYFERLDYAMILGYVETGCRLSELCKLKRADVDFNARTITFRDTKTDVERRIPVSDKWLDSVRKYLAVRPKKAAADTLFVGIFGNPVQPGWMCDKIKDYARYAGIPHVTAQTVRRWRLTALAHENIYLASAIGGNSISVLRRHYIKPDLDKMRQVMASTLTPEPSKTPRRKLV